MQSKTEDLIESEILLPSLLKTFEWMPNYQAVYSLYDKTFNIYDLLKKKRIIQKESASIYSSLLFEEKLLCGGLFNHNIDSFDLNKEEFTNVYKNKEFKASFLKLWKNNDGSYLAIKKLKKQKEHYLDIMDFRQANPLIDSKSFPLKNINNFDISNNLLTFTWNSDKIHSFSTINLNLVWPHEKDFEKGIKEDFQHKIKSEDFHLEQPISAIRISPSQKFIGIGRKNGILSLYEESEELSNICINYKLFLALNMHYKDIKETGKLPKKIESETCSIDFLPNSKGKKEEKLVSCGKEGLMKFFNFNRRKLISFAEIERSEKYNWNYCEYTRWDQTGEVLMVLKSQDVEGLEEEAEFCGSSCMKFGKSPIKNRKEKT